MDFEYFTCFVAKIVDSCIAQAIQRLKFGVEIGDSFLVGDSFTPLSIRCQFVNVSPYRGDKVVTAEQFAASGLSKGVGLGVNRFECQVQQCLGSQIVIIFETERVALMAQIY